MSQQTPLVLAAVPSKFQTGPTVKLKAGAYKIITDVIDSKVSIVIGRETRALHKETDFEFAENVDVYIVMSTPGTEQFFSVFAKRV